MALLEVKKLNVSVPAGGIEKALVKNVSFCVEKGEILGLVGGSGSGKSITSMAIAKVLTDEYIIKSEGVLFNGKRIDLMTQKELCKIRGSEIAYVFQEPMTSLNPLLTVGRQVEEALILHNRKFSTKVEKAERKKAVLTALADAGLEDPERLVKTYPHRLSGGQRQRVMIAMAMITKPQLLVADEITTALDVDTQSKVIDLLLHYREKYKISIIFISHDRKLVKRLADRIITLKNGEIVENSGVEGHFGKYDKYDLSKFSDEFENGTESEEKVILRVRNLAFAYSDTNLFGKKETKKVLENVGFDLLQGETLGIVGKSGSGKSTLVKIVSGLLKPDTGSVIFADGYEYPQMVFQDPYSSLNPARTIGGILREAYLLGEKRRGEKHKLFSEHERYKKAVLDALASVDLRSEIAYRRVRELSGGQRQRIAIACALISAPKVVILDEPVSAIDAEVCDQVLELLHRLKGAYGLSYIFISHDPDVINRTCDRVLVLENGKVRERE